MSDYENFNAENYQTPVEQDSALGEKVGFSEILRDEDFGTHFRVFTIIIGCLLAIDLLTGPGLWFQFVAISWGIGVSCHYWDTYINYNYKNDKKKDMYMHGAVTVTLVIFFFLMDLFTGYRVLSWWLWPSIPLTVAWLIHRATIFDSTKPRPSQQGHTHHNVRTEIIIEKTPASVSSSKPRFCANCGASVEDGFQFCKYCGKKVNLQ